MLCIVRDKIVIKSRQLPSKKLTTEPDDPSKSGIDVKKRDQVTLSKAVQAEMKEEAASFYFLVGFTNLVATDHCDGVLLYRQKKMKRNESVDLFKAALRENPSHSASLFGLALAYT